LAQGTVPVDIIPCKVGLIGDIASVLCRAMAVQLPSFFTAQDLDEATVSFLCSAFEEGGLEDVLEVAESFISKEALAYLRRLLKPQGAKPAALEKKSSPKALPLGPLAAQLLSEGEGYIEEQEVSTPVTQQLQNQRLSAK